MHCVHGFWLYIESTLDLDARFQILRMTKFSSGRPVRWMLTLCGRGIGDYGGSVLVMGHLTHFVLSVIG